jgi:hypothetical protein
MAVTSVTEMWPGRDGSDDIEKRTRLRRVYRVETDDIDDDATVAGGTTLLPRLGDLHPNYEAYVVGVVPHQLDEDPFLWDVAIEYSSELPTRSAVGGSGVPLGPGPESQSVNSAGATVNNPNPTVREADPRNRPAVWRRHTVEVEEPFEFDANGDPVLNSAGLPFDPPAMTKFRVLIATIVKNVSGIGNDDIDTYLDTINAATWKGVAAGKARVIVFDTASDMENGIPYTQVTLAIAIRKKGWTRKLIDRSFYVKTDLGLGAFSWDRIRDAKTGLAVSEPALLDGLGAQLAAGEPAVALEFDEFGESDFDALMTLLGIS